MCLNCRCQSAFLGLVGEVCNSFWHSWVHYGRWRPNHSFMLTRQMHHMHTTLSICIGHSLGIIDLDPRDAEDLHPFLNHSLRSLETPEDIDSQGGKPYLNLKGSTALILLKSNAHEWRGRGEREGGGGGMETCLSIKGAGLTGGEGRA